MLCWCAKMLTWLVKLISTLAERCCIIDCYTCLRATSCVLSEQCWALRTHITCSLVFHMYATLIGQIRTIGRTSLPAVDNSLFVTPRTCDHVSHSCKRSVKKTFNVKAPTHYNARCRCRPRDATDASVSSQHDFRTLSRCKSGWGFHHPRQHDALTGEQWHVAPCRSLWGHHPPNEPAHIP